MPRLTKQLPFILILLLAALMRLVSLQDVPPGLAQDEVLDAAIASLIRQGQHALFFREGYGHEPLYHYLAAPFAPLVGANVLSVRLPSVILGLLLVALTMRWARREFGSFAAAITGIGLAISWWPIVFSRIGIRPILEPVLLVAAAWFWTRRPWLAGLFLGLTVYSYTPARVVYLIPLLYILYLLAHSKFTPPPSPPPPLPSSSLVVLLVALALAIPLYLTLRADPSLQQRVEQLSGPVDALLQGDIQPILATTLATLGVFSFTGDPRWTYTLPNRPLFDAFTALFFYGGLLLALGRAWRQPKYAFILIWLAVTLLPSAITPDAPSTVRLVGAMPIVYLLPGLVIQWIYDLRLSIYDWVSRLRTTHHVPRLIPYAIYLTLILLFTLNLTRTIRDGFDRWSADVETRLRYQTVFLDMARHWQNDPAGTIIIADTFYEPIDQETLVLNGGYDLPARWVQGGGAIVFPAGGNGRLYVPEFAPPQDVLRLAAALPTTPLFQSHTRPTFAVYALPANPVIALITPTVTFDDAITLRGYELLPRLPGEPYHLLTYWQVEASALPWDLAIFVHLLGPDGTMVTQADGLDAAASTLYPGDSFIQLHTLTLPDPMPTGPYTLQLGLYVRGNGQRLTHPGEPSDRLILETDLAVDAP